MNCHNILVHLYGLNDFALVSNVLPCNDCQRDIRATAARHANEPVAGPSHVRDPVAEPMNPLPPPPQPARVVPARRPWRQAHLDEVCKILYHDYILLYIGIINP